MDGIEERVLKIEERNRRVELDKEWETSLARKVLIAILTYIVITLFFLVTQNSSPFLNAIIPTLGFLLSTLSLNYAKKLWIQNRKV
ncbi:hypothetical protein HYV12_02405 [Candidatus Dojkabacteria bacterium]|nr:hypothetical protein [Candidatus Dojkabacteria bacterium]